jgi:chromate transport protein ChrA
MAQAVVLILVGVTSAVALLIGTRGLRLRRSDLGQAIRKVLECVGVMLLFFTTNVALGIVAIIASRSLTGTFVSTYFVSDIALLVVSCLQGLLFQYWREGSREVRSECQVPRVER